jgi:hypothetical protein
MTMPLSRHVAYQSQEEGFSLKINYLGVNRTKLALNSRRLDTKINKYSIKFIYEFDK